MIINSKIQLLSYCALFGSIGCIIVFFGVVGLDILAHADLRTPEECNQLKGTMGDNPEENAAFLKKFPERANQLQKDNCLEGLQWLHDRLVIFYIVFPIFGFLAPFFQTYFMVRPRNGDFRK